jgi:hypothetical protein
VSSVYKKYAVAITNKNKEKGQGGIAMSLPTPQLSLSIRQAGKSPSSKAGEASVFETPFSFCLIKVQKPLFCQKLCYICRRGLLE